MPSSSLRGGLPPWLPAAFAAAVAAVFLRPVAPRDAGLVLAGMALAVAAAAAASGTHKPQCRTAWRSRDDDDPHTIRTIDELRDLMPAGASGTCLDDAKKVIDHLDDQMTDFVALSPILYLATVDSTTGTPFVSPKGDEPGFVSVVATTTTTTGSPDQRPRHTLVIPDRPGNRLLFGLQNIVGHTEGQPGGTESTAGDKKPAATPERLLPRVSVLFEVPGCGTTLRCGGTARLSRDPALLAGHTARGCPPRLVILVDVDHAFFHCAKAYMRSRVWDPAAWPSPPPRVTFGRYFAGRDSVLARTIDSGVDKHYRDVQKAIDVEACEQEA